MYGLLPKRAESLGLFFAAIAILCSRSNIERQIPQRPQQKGFYKPQSQIFTKNTQSSVNALRRALPQVATAARTPKSISKTTPFTQPKPSAEPKSSGNGWYYSWQTKFESPIPGDSIFTTFLQAESPYSSRLGSLEIRSEFPVHLLWRQPPKTALSAYPPELAELRWAPFPQNLLHAMYRSKLYLRWAIPGKKASKSDHLGSYLQIGSIRARAQSPWQFLNRSTPFPTSPKPISTAIPPGLLPGQYFASTEYESEKGIGQNIGLSLDSPNLQGFLLHQRNLRSESLQSGLALQLEKRSPQVQNSRSFVQNTENLYRIRFASLFSQNLSKAPLQSGWYLPHIQQPQNSGLYRSKQRWAELLRYDRAVKQFWLQARWSQVQQAGGQKRKIELRTEQSSSVSPLDYWGLHQRYHLLLELPLYARKSAPSRIKKLVLGNYLFASYTDANWVDAQRRLAGSSRAQFYRRRLVVQNRMSWRFSQTFGGAQNHILRAVAGAKIARFLEPKMLGYVDFGLEYYWLRTRKETNRPERTWYIMSKADFAQKPASTRQKPPVMPVLWEQILVLGVGWKQNPPNRVPQADRPNTSARLGWKLNIQGRQSDLIFGTGTKRLEGSLNLFVQFWRYGRYVRRTSTLRWWKLLELQCRFGTKLSWFGGRAKAGFWGQLRGRLQLAKNWSFELVLKLESVQKPVGFFESPSIRLVLSHEFAGAAGAKEERELTEPIEAFEDAFRETAPM